MGHLRENNNIEHWFTSMINDHQRPLAIKLTTFKRFTGGNQMQTMRGQSGRGNILCYDVTFNKRRICFVHTSP